MIYYKSARYIDGKARIVITDDNDNIIKNPTKDQKKLAIVDDRKKPKDYLNVKCCKCGNGKTYIKPNGRPSWYRCNCGRIGCSGYICSICYFEKIRNFPDSYNNIIKQLASVRIGQLDIENLHDDAKGLIGEAIIAKVRKLEMAIKSTKNLIMTHITVF